jgi:hypothetical protein
MPNGFAWAWERRLNFEDMPTQSRWVCHPELALADVQCCLPIIRGRKHYKTGCLRWSDLVTLKVVATVPASSFLRRFRIMAQRRILRGLVAAMVISLLCHIFATWWIVTALSGLVPRIAHPYNDTWYMLAVIAPAAILWFWYFSGPAPAESVVAPFEETPKTTAPKGVP